MSKSHYLSCKFLHSFASKMQRVKVGNGQYIVCCLSLLKVIHDHRFEIFTLVTGINVNIDLV